VAVDDGCAQADELHRVRKIFWGLDVLCIRWVNQEPEGLYDLAQSVNWEIYVLFIVMRMIFLSLVVYFVRLLHKVLVVAHSTNFVA
jgi:hypothetical protein